MSGHSSTIITYLGEGTAASRPTSLNIATSALGLFYATDTKVLSLWNGATPGWDTLSGGGGGSGTVTSVGSGTGLTGGPITASGTLALAAIANDSLLANTAGSSAAPVPTTLSALLDAAIGSTQGDVLFRGASAWSALAPGTSGQVLTSGGAGANPSWAAAAGGSSVLTGGAINSAATTPTYSSSAFAWKGIPLALNASMTIHGMQALLNATSGQVYQGAVIEYSAGVITSVLGLTGTITAATSGGAMFDFNFASPVALTVGNTYAVLVGITSGTGTTSVPVQSAPSNVSPIPRSALAVDDVRVAELVLAAGQAVDLTGVPTVGVALLYS